MKLPEPTRYIGYCKKASIKDDGFVQTVDVERSTHFIWSRLWTDEQVVEMVVLADNPEKLSALLAQLRHMFPFPTEECPDCEGIGKINVGTGFMCGNSGCDAWPELAKCEKCRGAGRISNAKSG